jgi:mRNA interferase MazF
MARLLRGDIVWADLDPVKGREQAGRSPVLILSHDIFNERSGTVIAMALTSQVQRAGFRSPWSWISKVFQRNHGLKLAKFERFQSNGSVGG